MRITCQIWRLTWESPYETGDAYLSYDVRVLGHCFTARNMGTEIHAFDPNPGKNGLLDIWAGRAPAEIWIPSNTEFYIHNESIQVHVESYKITDIQ